MDETFPIPPEEIVVARASIGPVFVLAAGTFVFSIVLALYLAQETNVLLGIAWFVIAAAFHSWLLRGVLAMKLSVTAEAVRVVNLRSHFDLDLATARIDSQVVGQNPTDELFALKPEVDSDGLPSQSQARGLFLTDDTEVRAKVGLAPSYGSRLDQIAEDFYKALEVMRPSP